MLCCIPLCCKSLETFTKTIAIFIMVGSVLSIIFAAIVGATVAGTQNEVFVSKASELELLSSGEKLTNYDESNGAIKLDGHVYIHYKLYLEDHFNMFRLFIFILLLGYGLVSTMNLTLAIQLWKGANQRDYSTCNVWVQVELASCSASLILLTTFILIGVHGFKMTWNPTLTGMVIGAVVGFFFRLFFVRVVYTFMKELKAEENTVSAIPTEKALSKVDITNLA